jgi:hypothetical protein
MVKKYLKFIRRPKNKINMLGKKRRLIESFKLKGYKIRKTTFYRFKKRQKKYKRYFLRRIHHRFLKSMNMRKIRKSLVDIYHKFNKFCGMSNKIKYFIFKKQQQNAITAQQCQVILRRKNLHNYAKRTMYLFKTVYKLKKEKNNKNYIYKYFKKLYRKYNKKVSKNYIATYFKHIYKKKIKFSIFKYCKNKIPTQGGTTNMLTTLRRLLIFRVTKKKLKNSILQYNRNKLS